MTITPPLLPQAQEPARSLGRRAALLLIGAVVLFLTTYVLAWLSAYNLAHAFWEQAEASYAEGRYMDALTGYRVFDEKQRRYITYGGFMHVENIWSDPAAFPVPPEFERAKQRIREILQKRLTIEDAEQYIAENIGRTSNPYLGIVYLRLGELYEAAGRLDEALEIYASVDEYFPEAHDLIAQAQAHLARLSN
ncbi:MAG: hypothetical protein ACK4P1_00485 [Aggregatilineales bacterium]